MFCIVLEFPDRQVGKDPKKLNWVAVHSFFYYLFPEEFVCVLKPYNNNDCQAKVFFKQKVSIPENSNQVEIDNFQALIVDCHDEECLSATRTQVQRLPACPDNLNRIVSELLERFKVQVMCMPDTDNDNGASVVLSLTGCHEEVLEAALEAVSRLLKSTNPAGASSRLPEVAAASAGRVIAAPGAATAATASPTAPAAPAVSAAAGRRPRKPLFSPEVIAAADSAREAEEAAKKLQQPTQQQPTQTQQPSQQEQQQPIQQQHPKGLSPLSQPIAFNLSPNCRLTIGCGDLTRVENVDLLVATTNGSLSLKFGLAKALATKWGFQKIESDCQRHLRSVYKGQIPFGGTFLSHEGQILFVVLPNDRRLLEGPPGRARELRLDVDRCLNDTMKQLVALAGDESRPGFRRVAMPTLGSTLPLWGEGNRDEWADALAGALARLAVGPRGAGCLSELRVYCVSDEAARLLGNAVAERLCGGGETASAGSGSSHAGGSGGGAKSAAAGNAASCPPPVEKMDVDEDSTVTTATAAVVPSAPPATYDTCCFLCAYEISAKNPATPFHCLNTDSNLLLCAGCVARLTDPTQPSDGKCVVCFERYRPAVGSQPSDGRMKVTTEAESLPGHEGTGTIVINYEFDSGTLDGTAYKGIHRTAYLPDSTEGRNLLQRLQTAFAGRVIFSVGVSATTEKHAITWNTVHHKTNKTGGASRHGYPDRDYLQRTSDELSALGY